MAEISNPASALVSRLEGYHFFGFDGAPCSQRVGFALAEKGLRRQRAVHFMDDSPAALTARPGHYIFRRVSLIKHDNLTPEYAAIQPHMVVPALVRDGRLWIESMDIVSYLDEAIPAPPLRPTDPAAAELSDALVQLGKDLHVSIRHITFHWSLGRLGKTNARTQRTLAQLQQDGSPEQLAEFYARFNANEIEADEFLRHLRRVEDAYAEQEARLTSDGREFLTGATFSTADIIWGIKVLRLVESGYPLTRNFPALATWFERVRRRPGFRQGVVGHYRFLHYAMRLKAEIGNLLGNGIKHSSRTPAAV